MANPYLGEIRMIGFTFAPLGWALCNGQLMSISQNAALFDILGTTYGGDGVTTFALPNFQGNVPIHVGPNYVAGQTGGSTSVSLTTNQLPAHAHVINALASGGNQATPQSGFPAIESTGTSLNYSSSAANTTMNTGVVGPTGGNQPVSIVQPYLCVNFIIALQGIFPSRS